jgi:hypothetical protein
MIVAAKQQILLYKAAHKKKPLCQWCFEEPAVEGKTVCQACIDAATKKEEDDFDLDKWLEEDDEHREAITENE